MFLGGQGAVGLAKVISVYPITEISRGAAIKKSLEEFLYSRVKLFVLRFSSFS